MLITNASLALVATLVAGVLGAAGSRVLDVQEASGLSSSEEVVVVSPPEFNVAAFTLNERLEVCECFMVVNDDQGTFYEALAEAIRTAIIANQHEVANELLLVLEREVQRTIFHDYLRGEYRDEVERRVSVLRLAREH